MGTLNNLESVCFLGGIFFLLLTYATLGLALVLYYLKCIRVHARRYFCNTATLERKILANQIRHHTLSIQCRLEQQQLHYRSEHKRQRLSSTNHKKHMRQLAKAIQQELNSVRHLISWHRFQSLRKNLRSCFRTGNVEGLIALHSEIQTLL